MKNKILIILLALFLVVPPISSRVRVRYVGSDNRTEEQKKKDKEEGMTLGILIAIVIGGFVIWGKVRNNKL